MKLSKKEFLKGSSDPKTLEILLELAENAFKTWQPIWSPFISAPILEEIKKIINPLEEIRFKTYGGFNNAERNRLLFERNLNKNDYQQVPIIGIQVSGNFLFDKATRDDYINDLYNHGISYQEIGDLWILGDRGAQLICTQEAGQSLNQKKSIINTVKVTYKLLELDQLRLPLRKAPKKINTVEASNRIDAIASAGFGLSRAKTVKQIKEGKLRLNWEPATSSFQVLVAGDTIQMEERGSLKVLSIQLTKKERWKIELLRE